MKDFSYYFFNKYRLPNYFVLGCGSPYCRVCRARLGEKWDGYP